MRAEILARLSRTTRFPGVLADRVCRNPEPKVGAILDVPIENQVRSGRDCQRVSMTTWKPKRCAGSEERCAGFSVLGRLADRKTGVSSGRSRMAREIGAWQ